MAEEKKKEPPAGAGCLGCVALLFLGGLGLAVVLTLLAMAWMVTAALAKWAGLWGG